MANSAAPSSSGRLLLALLISLVAVWPIRASSGGDEPDKAVTDGAEDEAVPEAEKPMAAAPDPSQADQRATGAAARAAVEAATPAMEPAARQLCRSWDPNDEIEQVRAGGSAIDFLGDASGVFSVAFRCLYKRVDGSRSDAWVLLRGHLVKSENGWIAAAASPSGDQGTGMGGAPVFDEDQVEEDSPSTASGTTAGGGETGALSQLAEALLFIRAWLAEVLGIGTFTIFLVVVVVRRRWPRFGIGGWVEALNLFTGMVVGFFVGLVIWHSLPDWVRYGGAQDSTPLWLYLFLPAPLAAFGAIGCHFGLGRVWSNTVVSDSKTRLVLGGLEAILSAATLRVILACVF